MKETFKVIARKTTEGLQVESEARGFKLIMDEPEGLGLSLIHILSKALQDEIIERTEQSFH